MHQPYTSTQDYTGFSFNEKKTFKELETAKCGAAMKQIHDKLGQQWKLVIDWPEFAKIIPATADGNYEARDNFHLLAGRVDLGAVIYNTFVETMGNDVATWDPDFCEGVNEKATAKTIRITVWPGVDYLDGYLPANKTELRSGELVIKIQPRRVTERFTNSWGCMSEKPWSYHVDLAMMNPVSEASSSSGGSHATFASVHDYTGFSFGDKKVFKEREEKQWFPAQQTIHQKLGPQWKLTVDWPAFAKVIPAEGRFNNTFTREDLGFYLYEVYCKTIGDDVEKWEPDLIEAVNDKVTSKTIRITVWPIDDDNKDSYKVEIVSGEILISIQPKRLSYAFSNWGYGGYTTFNPFSQYIGALV